MFPHANALVGRSLSGYRLESILGRGGTGIVYLGVSIDTPGQLAAIKLLAPNWQSTMDELDMIRQRFLREVETLQRLRNPHILTIQGFGQTFGEQGTLTYMILPYIDGETLTARISRGAMPLPEVARLLADLADAVDYAHRLGIIHRDIKPANILLDRRGNVYLSDFGIVRLFDETRTNLTASGQIIGTPEYMSPEQATGEAITPATDQYSLGVVLYEMVTGRVPFQGPSVLDFLKQHAQQPPLPPRNLRLELPEPAQAAILRALAKPPAQRFPDTRALAIAFAEGIQGRWSEELLATTKIPIPFPPSGPDPRQPYTPPAGSPPMQPHLSLPRSMPVSPTVGAMTPPTIGGMPPSGPIPGYPLPAMPPSYVPPGYPPSGPAYPPGYVPPGYPPSGPAYPPSGGYPPSWPAYPPGAYTPPGMPPTGPAYSPGAEYPPGYPPPGGKPPQRSSSRLLFGLGGGIAALLILVLIVVLVARGDLTGTSSLVQATATPSPTATLYPTLTPTPIQTTYTSSPFPGPGCDSTGGYWQTLDNTPPTVTNCTASGFQLIQPEGAQYLAEVEFQWRGHPFSTNYTVQVQLSQLTNACAGVLTNNNGQTANGYGFYLCSDKTWNIYKYATSGTPTLERSGTLSGTSFTIDVQIAPGTEGLAIVNGDTYNLHDTDYTTTDNIGLGIVALTSTQAGSGVFSGFTYTDQSQG